MPVARNPIVAPKPVSSATEQAESPVSCSRPREVLIGIDGDYGEEGADLVDRLLSERRQP
ncbi:MAG: hypothetical protein AAF439_10150 [Pseudomonadota bacterium]